MASEEYEVKYLGIDPAELETKKSFLEENSQVTRKVTIA